MIAKGTHTSTSSVTSMPLPTSPPPPPSVGRREKATYQHRSAEEETFKRFVDLAGGSNGKYDMRSETKKERYSNNSIVTSLVSASALSSHSTTVRSPYLEPAIATTSVNMKEKIPSNVAKAMADILLHPNSILRKQAPPFRPARADTRSYEQIHMLTASACEINSEGKSLRGGGGIDESSLKAIIELAFKQKLPSTMRGKAASNGGSTLASPPSTSSINGKGVCST